nr:hypothetical protein [Tanacetum cinerariifolium]
MTEVDVQNILEIFPVLEFKVEALQVKYPIIDWEIHTEEKDYPFSNVVMILMLSGKLQVEEDNEMARDLVMKIFMEANKPKSRNKEKAQRNYYCWFNITAAGSTLVLLDKVGATAEVLKNLL